MDLIPDAHLLVQIGLTVPDVHWKLVDQPVMVARHLQPIEHIKGKRDVTVGLLLVLYLA